MKILEALKKLFLTSDAKPAIMATSNEEGSFMTETAKNYTEAQEARMLEVGVIDAAKAEELAIEFGKNPKSVIAKAVRLGIYKAKEKASKAGGKIETKEQIVQEIADLVGKNLDGLEKASKQALVAIRAKLSA